MSDFEDYSDDEFFEWDDSYVPESPDAADELAERALPDLVYNYDSDYGFDDYPLSDSYYYFELDYGSDDNDSVVAGLGERRTQDVSKTGEKRKAKAGHTRQSKKMKGASGAVAPPSYQPVRWISKETQMRSFMHREPSSLDELGEPYALLKDWRDRFHTNKSFADFKKGAARLPLPSPPLESPKNKNSLDSPESTPPGEGMPPTPALSVSSRGSSLLESVLIPKIDTSGYQTDVADGPLHLLSHTNSQKAKPKAIRARKATSAASEVTDPTTPARTRGRKRKVEDTESAEQDGGTRKSKVTRVNPAAQAPTASAGRSARRSTKSTADAKAKPKQSAAKPSTTRTTRSSKTRNI